MTTNGRTTCSLDELMGFHCAPTLLGEKTGSLMCVRAACFEHMKERFLLLRGKLAPMGVEMEVLRVRADAVLIYVYRPALLRADMGRPPVRRILRPLGYTRAQALKRLRARLSEEDFPHEIGLFLGYPPEDVFGFIENRGANCKLCGCWKVYGDVESAREAFARFERCRCCFKACMQRGMAIEAIVRVAGRQETKQERKRSIWTRSA